MWDLYMNSSTSYITAHGKTLRGYSKLDCIWQLETTISGSVYKRRVYYDFPSKGIFFTIAKCSPIVRPFLHAEKYFLLDQ